MSYTASVDVFEGEGLHVSTVSPAAAAGGDGVAATLPPKALAPHLPRQLSDAEFVMLRGAG
ncbi:MAG: hypothetical protein JF591_23465, partial [Lysobacter sp.]|nr:hypothetical protein [Lysobacter sp.]